MLHFLKWTARDLQILKLYIYLIFRDLKLGSRIAFVFLNRKNISTWIIRRSRVRYAHVSICAMIPMTPERILSISFFSTLRSTKVCQFHTTKSVKFCYHLMAVEAGQGSLRLRSGIFLTTMDKRQVVRWGWGWAVSVEDHFGYHRSWSCACT